MSRSALKSIAASLRLAARPEGVTTEDVAIETGLSRSAARKILAGLESEGLLVSEEPARKGMPRGEYKKVWKTSSPPLTCGV